MDQKEYKGNKKLLVELLKSEFIPFPKNGYIVNAPDDQGVYIIFSPRNTVWHVGRTQRAKRGLYQRLQNHLRGQSSFVYTFLNQDCEKLRKGCKYKYVVIENSRNRALVEALATGKLCPKHLGLGKKLKK